MGLALGPPGLAPQPDPPAPALAGPHRHTLEPLRPFRQSGPPQAKFPSPVHDRRPFQGVGARILESPAPGVRVELCLALSVGSPAP